MSLEQFVKILSVFTLATEACQPRASQFKMNTSLANWVHPDHLLFQSSALSRLGCAMQCSKTPSCVSFTYPGSLHTPGTCRGHSTRHFSVGDAQPTLGVSTFLMKEVEASNMAVHRSASQSSTSHNATKANDGSFRNGFTFNHFQCAQTEAAAGERSWWQVDLEACYAILSVIITARADCCPERLHDFDVDVYDKDPEVYPGASSTRCYHYVGVMPAGVTEELVCDNKPIVGRVVRITDAPGEYLTLCEVQVMAVP